MPDCRCGHTRSIHQHYTAGSSYCSVMWCPCGRYFPGLLARLLRRS